MVAALASRAPRVVLLRLQALAAAPSLSGASSVDVGLHSPVLRFFSSSVFLLHDFIADIKRPGLWLSSVHTEGTISVLRFRGEGQGPTLGTVLPAPHPYPRHAAARVSRGLPGGGSFRSLSSQAPGFPLTAGFSGVVSGGSPGRDRAFPSPPHCPSTSWAISSTLSSNSAAEVFISAAVILSSKNSFCPLTHMDVLSSWGYAWLF